MSRKGAANKGFKPSRGNCQIPLGSDLSRTYNCTREGRYFCLTSWLSCCLSYIRAHTTLPDHRSESCMLNFSHLFAFHTDKPSQPNLPAALQYSYPLVPDQPLYFVRAYQHSFLFRPLACEVRIPLRRIIINVSLICLYAVVNSNCCLSFIPFFLGSITLRVTLDSLT